MNRSRIVLFVAALMVLACALAGAQARQTMVVPINGEYWDNEAGGLLVYGGTIALSWTPGSDQACVCGSLVATAWSKNTGASYTLYGWYPDIFAGDTALLPEMARSVLAIGAGSRPEFETNISIRLAQLPQEVQHLAFAGQ